MTTKIIKWAKYEKERPIRERKQQGGEVEGVQKRRRAIVIIARRFAESEDAGLIAEFKIDENRCTIRPRKKRERTCSGDERRTGRQEDGPQEWG